EEIYAERLGGHGAHEPNLCTDKLGRLKGHSEHAEPPSVAYCRCEFCAGQAPNWRLHDRVRYSQLLRQPGREHRDGPLSVNIRSTYSGKGAQLEAEALRLRNS